MMDFQAVLRERYPDLHIRAKLDPGRGILSLSGRCGSWQTVVDIGHLAAAQPGVKSVVSDLAAEDSPAPKKDYGPIARAGRRIGTIARADVVIVGAGVTGCAIARELARYNLSIVVVEKEEDVAGGATKANNGDIHSGYLETPGTLKARLNVRGNAMYPQWARELGFEFSRRGNLLVITDERFRGDLLEARERSLANGVPCEIITGERVLEMEPLAGASAKKPVAALYVPSMGVVEPWEVAIALAENAAHNGVRFLLDCPVGDVLRKNGRAAGVVTGRGIVEAPYVVNCAGVYADEISQMAGDRCYTIHPRKGTIAIIDKSVPAYTRPYRSVDENHPLRSTKHTKGGGMATTIMGNNLLGPSATEVPDKEDMETTPGDLAVAMARSCIDEIGYHNVIRFFSGTRPATYTEDFYIELSPVTHGFLNVGGIQSPGLAAAPAVAELAISLLVEDMRASGRPPAPNPAFDPIRAPQVRFAELSREEQDALIARRPEYGRVVCRCETITEGEILDVLRSPILPASVDAVKRRTRAGMGRCQGGFCQPRVVELLARELGRPWTAIPLKGPGSCILTAENRTRGEEEP